MGGFNIPGLGGNNFNLGDTISGIGNLGSQLYGLGIIGGNGTKTDRAAQLAGRQGLWDIFGFGLPQGENQQIAGQQTIGTALNTLQSPQAYYQQLLTGGRPTYASLSAPAINTALAGQDTAARQSATMGTARTGGTAALQAEAGANTQQQIDDIINQNLMQGRATGAAGLTQISGQQAQIGDMQLANSLRLLGLGEDAVKAIMNDARLSQLFQNALHQQNAQGIKNLLNSIGGALGGNKGATKPFTTPPFVPPQTPLIPQAPDAPGYTPPTFPLGIGGPSGPGNNGTTVSSTVTTYTDPITGQPISGSTTLDPSQLYPSGVPIDPNAPIQNDPYGGYYGGPTTTVGSDTGYPPDYWGYGGGGGGDGAYSGGAVDPGSQLADLGNAMYGY